MNNPSTAAAAGSPTPKPAPSATGSAFAESGGVDADGGGLTVDDGGKKDVVVAMVDDELIGGDGATVIVTGTEEVDAVAGRMTPFPAAQQEVFELPQHQLPSTHFNMTVDEDNTPAAEKVSHIICGSWMSSLDVQGHAFTQLPELHVWSVHASLL